MLGLARGRGHQWVVLAVNVRFPFSARPGPCRCCARAVPHPGGRHAGGAAHKTPITLARQLVAALLHWFPDRRFVLLGDGHYASHELARFCRGHRRRLTLVSLFHPRRTCASRRRRGGRDAFPWYAKTDVTFSDALAGVRYVPSATSLPPPQ